MRVLRRPHRLARARATCRRSAHAAQLAPRPGRYNFGVQEGGGFTQQTQTSFPAARVKNGYIYAKDKPGWGMDLDEKLAAKFPVADGPPNFDYSWGTTRPI